MTDNLWIPVTEVLRVVEASLSRAWNWTQNTRCKYIGLRIDMRDGRCLIKDREGHLISLDTLRAQYAAEPNVPAQESTMPLTDQALEFAATDLVDKYCQQIDTVLKALGYSGAWVSDESQIGDFTMGGVNLDEKIAKLKEMVDMEITHNTYLVDIAKALAQDC